MPIGSMSQRAVAGAGLVVTVLYATWLGWPYLESTVVRDAALTSWVNVVSSPISGYTTNPLYPGARIAVDRRIATITDDRADGRELARAQAESVRAGAAVVAQEQLVDGMKRALDVRSTHANGFATTFSQDLDAAITGATATLASLEARRTLAQAEVDRQVGMKGSGATSQTALDSARSTIASIEQEMAETNARLARADKRQRAARDGVFLLEDGTDGNSAFQNLADAQLRLKQAEASLTQLRAERDATQAILQAAEHAYEKSRSLDILAPKDAMVWSLISGPGAPVQPGSPVASWVDCRLMLVDVPVSDVEASLVHVGTTADVVLEGERATRHGTVVLTRGSAGTLGDRDLAAVAKGRRPGLGQVIVNLVPSDADVRTCAIGEAAYVDFPDVGIVAILRGRLRL